MAENKIKTVEQAKDAYSSMNTTTKNAILQNVKRDFVNAAMKDARERANRAFNDMGKEDILKMVYTSMLASE